jgi:hypothetical protein
MTDPLTDTAITLANRLCERLVNRLARQRHLNATTMAASSIDLATIDFFSWQRPSVARMGVFGVQRGSIDANQ